MPHNLSEDGEQMETRYVLNRNKGFYSKIYLTVQTGHVNMKSEF